jgi:UDP-3-O-[3-hydroxymyristoyl] glucosamine N-acyltransferase
VELGDRCRVGANSVVGAECRLGADTVLHANVTLYPRTVVGARVTIHSGAVLGAAGYGYRQDGGRHVPIPQLGVVVIEDEVDIGANTCIDRATIGETRIGAGTKIDNLVQIAHNCSLGRACLVIGQVGMGGSCEVGDGVVLAGQVGLADHVTIGSGARVGAQSGVAREVPAGGRYVGTPAVPAVEAHRIHLAWRRLPGMLRAWQATRTASEGEVGDAP